ncbi:MAG TPA: DUF4097 family beta strand repeat-containing protein [Streptosporangiaceae bacterium]|jgi:hypothetical protein
MTSWEFPAEGPVEARIRIASGTVAVTAATTETVTVEIHGSRRHGRDPDTLPTVEYQAGQLTITGPEPSRLLRQTPGFEVAVTVPRGSRCVIDSASADIHCSGELARLSATTASGDVAAEHVTDKCDVTTASGDVWLDTSGPAWLKTVSGDVRVEHAQAGVNCQTVSGDVKLSAVASGEISVKTTSGDIVVAVAADTGVQLDLYTLTGDASSDLEPEGQAGAADATVSLRSISGDVAVRKVA